MAYGCLQTDEDCTHSWRTFGADLWKFKSTLTDDDFYNGLQTPTEEDPYEKQARGLSSRNLRDKGGDLPAKDSGGAPAKPAERFAAADGVSLGKGSRVTVTDRDGVERPGTVANANDLAVRVKTDDGGEITAKPSNVMPDGTVLQTTAAEPPAVVAQTPAKAQNTGDEFSLPSRTAGTTPGNDPAGGGRPSTDTGSADSLGVEPVASELPQDARGEAGGEVASHGDGAALHPDISPVRGEGSAGEHRVGNGSGVE